MATSPGLLLLDEPLSALDARVRVHLRSEIKDLQRRLGVTTVMVTHDQEEALTMADRIVVMKDGVIEQIGTPEEIYGNPATTFVADFIGTMNFVSGIISKDGEVDITGHHLNADTTGFSVGDKVQLAIRPEDVNAQDIHEGDDNIVDAEITHLEFMGAFYRADLHGDSFSDHDIQADFSINLVRRKSISVGSKLPVRFPSNLIRIYAEV